MNEPLLTRVERFSDPVAEFPWGILAFLFILVLGGLDLIFTWLTLSLKDYLTAIGASAGLLGIGHGIRTQQRTRARGPESTSE
jgi:hypothetical protein